MQPPISDTAIFKLPLCYVLLVTLTMVVREGVLPLCGGGGTAFLLGPFDFSLFAACAPDWPD